MEEADNAGDGAEFKQMNRKDDDKTKSDEEILEEQYQAFLKEFFEGPKEKEEDKEADKKKKTR